MGDLTMKEKVLSILRTCIWCGLAISAACASPLASAQCGELYSDGQFGPFDYTDPGNADSLRNVNTNHFNADVEGLRKGMSTSLGGDLDYALRAFPNHHRALSAMMRLGRRDRSDKVYGAHFSVECYFLRAVEFKPDDSIVRLLYGVYLAGKKRYKDALEQLQAGEKASPNDANLKYNLGLTLFELRRYEEAAAYAKQAYDLGFQLPGLRRKLESVGAWPAN